MKKAIAFLTASNRSRLAARAIVCLLSLSFLLLLYRNLSDYRSLSIKFAVIDFVASNGLGWLLPVLLGVQGFLALGIFLTGTTFFRWVYETIFLIYLAGIISYLIYLNRYVDCVECNFGLSYFHENFLVTILISMATLFLYFCVQWLRSREGDNRQG